MAKRNNRKQPAISLKNVSKVYTLHHEKPTFVETVLKKSYSEQYTALDNINLDIYAGEKIGIIGPNGAGKTTLLKIISGITTPTSGSVKVRGKIVSLIGLDAGFHDELTGEENIFLNGLIIGMSKDKIRKKFNDIVAFADIKQFIDAPLFTYSQGMKLRLGFAVAVHSDPDILLLDEGFSVGDESFRKKSMERIDDFFKAGKTVVMVSHWVEFLEKICERMIAVEDGGLVIPTFNLESAH